MFRTPPSAHSRATTVLPFHDRADAGRRLATVLSHLHGEPVVVVGLARGGVLVAAEVALALDAPLTALAVKKIGVPWQPEVALGAVAPDAVIMDDRMADAMNVSQRYIALGVSRAATEVHERATLYRGRHEAPAIEGRIAVLVDDGLATGATAAVAVASVRHHKPRRIIVAVPVGSVEAVQYIETLADEVVCLDAPVPLSSIGEWYERFEPVSEDAVLSALRRGNTKVR